LRDAFNQLDPPTLRARLDEDPQFAGFRSALDDFLAEYGQRETVSPLVMSAPTWSDDPALPLDVIKVLVEERPQTPATRPSAEAERRLLDHRLLRSRRRRAAVLHLVEAARAGVAFREDSHFYATWAIPMLRRTLLEAGRRLAAAGVLPKAEDVFHLRLAELEALTEPDGLTAVEADRMRSVAAGARGPACRTGRSADDRCRQLARAGCCRKGRLGERRSRERWPGDRACTAYQRASGVRHYAQR
jgi:pyruvate,water dikinase